MPKNFIDISAFHARVKDGKRPHSAVRLAGPSQVVVADEARTATFIFSDNSVDRYGDTIDARGWQLDNYRANPVALFGHDAGTAENVIGKTIEVKVEGNQLIGVIEFAPADVNPRADQVFKMVKSGLLNCVSVGFAPLEWKAANDRNRPGGIDFKKQELLEISIVPIPANPNAVAVARAAGLDVDLLELRSDGLSISKKGLYEVSWLASLLAELGYLEGWVEDEAAWEGDNSPVPAMLAEALKQLGAALIAMTAEEVAELLGEESAEKVAATPAQKAIATIMRSLKAKMVDQREVNLKFTLDTSALTKSLGELGLMRAGKTISAKNEQVLRDAHGMMTQACDMIIGVVGEPEETDPPEDDVAKAARQRKARALQYAAQPA